MFAICSHCWSGLSGAIRWITLTMENNEFDRLPPKSELNIRAIFVRQIRGCVGSYEMKALAGCAALAFIKNGTYITSLYSEISSEFVIHDQSTDLSFHFNGF